MPSERPFRIVDPPTLEELAAAAEAVGLPAPSGVTALSQPLVRIAYRVSFPEDAAFSDVVFRRVVADPFGDDPLGRELAALRALERVQALPTPSGYRVLPTGVVPYPCAFQAWVPGRAGDAWLADEPQHASLIYRTLGTLLTTLQGGKAPAASASTSGGRFVLGGTWAQLVEARLDVLEARIRGAGLWLEGVCDGLLSRIRDRLPEAELVGSEGTPACLVHGDLRPQNLIFDRTGTTLVLRAVIDWEHAVLGDPYYDVASLVLDPSVPLHHVARGHTRRQAQAWLTPTGLRRIELCAALRVLGAIGFAASVTPLGDGARLRAFAVDHAVHHARMVAEPGWLKARLVAAMAGRDDSASARLPAVHTRRNRQALQRLAYPTRLADTPLHVEALSAGWVHTQLDGQGQESWGAYADALLQHTALSGPDLPALAAPVHPDDARWTALLPSLLGEAATTPRADVAVALALWWATDLAHHATGRTVDPTVRGGVLALLTKLMGSGKGFIFRTPDTLKGALSAHVVHTALKAALAHAQDPTPAADHPLWAWATASLSDGRPGGADARVLSAVSRRLGDDAALGSDRAALLRQAHHAASIEPAAAEVLRSDEGSSDGSS